MADYNVGYRKPPKGTQFKPGISGNPKGRPTRGAFPLADIVNGVFDALVSYRENGRKRTGTKREVALKLLVQRAINGDVAAADMVHRKYTDAMRRSGTGATRLLIHDWLPDHPGQTAEQKRRDFSTGNDHPTITREWADPKVGR